MAKRVFELARELNLTTKELLIKFKDVDVPVKSHMSTLDDSEEAKVRETLFGKKSDDAIEETRIRSTVIRRRRKPIQEEEGEEKLISANETQQQELTSEIPASEKDFIPTTAPVEKESEEILPKAISAKRAVTKTQEPKPAAPAEISVAKGGGESHEDAVFEKSAATSEGRMDKEPASISDMPAEELRILASTERETEAAAEPESGISPEITPMAAMPGMEETPHEEPVTEIFETAVSPKAGKTKKVKKKTSKDTPARIIQLPVVPPEPVIEKKIEGTPDEAKDLRRPERPKPVIEKRMDRPPLDTVSHRKPERLKPELPLIVEPESELDRKKGKRSKKIAIAVTEDLSVKDKKFFKKKIAFRHKEVIEGAALYTVDKRNRKGRKGAKAAKITTDQKPQITVAKAIKRRVKIDDTIVLAELAKRMGIKAADMIRTLMGLGVMVTVNQTIDFETAVLVASEFDYEVERAAFEEDTIMKTQADAPENMMPRPPVVTIMGHVDHGKTSLLDVIRKTRVTATEAGGITQHIGAYNVRTDRGQVVFLDTPGHEAFTAMRARGAKVTDLVVLVVAADDGVMPQTIEAINHAKASSVPILVAINKIDKPNAQPDRVIRQLSEIGLAPEEWGGDTIFVHVSAKQNQGIDELLEMILLQAEMLELRANPNRLATGHVVESKLDSGRGPVATVLVQGGTLHNGDSVVCGVHYGKIRAMLNELGKQVPFAGPSTPVEIIGLSGVPMAGDEMVALESEKDAKQVSLHRTQKLRSQELAKSSRMSLEGLFEKMKTGEVKDLNLIIKADVDGSIEALRDSLVKLSNEEVKINVVHSATGTITESDVSLAAVSNAIIIGFNVRPNTKVSDMAQEENVDVRLHSVIYDVIQEVKNAIVGMMASTFEERVLGKAEVREIFHVPKVGAIAGCMVTDGKIERGQLARIIRDGVIRYEGKISSLRRFKDDAKEVNTGYECGIGISNFNDIKLGDVIECYYLEEIKPELQ
jgi:translation initiation factor IF-2